jgi:hypothetical protein
MNNAGGGDSGPIVRKRKLPSIALKIPISELQGKAYVYTLLSDPRACKASMLYTVIMNITVFVSTMVLVVETLFIENPITLVWYIFDTVFVTFFTFDMWARFLTCPDKCAFAQDTMNWLDFISTAPYYFQFFTDGFMYNSINGMLRCLRAFRHIRLIRVTKSGPIMITLEQSMRKSVSALTVPIFYMLLSMVVLSALCYFIELDEGCDETVAGECEAYTGDYPAFHPESPGWNPWNRPAFDSLPHAMWWCVVTMTGTGYGDMYPVTWKGQIVASVTAAIGVFFIAMPFAVSGGSFWHAWSVYVEERELERMMKEGNTTEELTPEELGFQDKNEIKLLSLCYGSSLPMAEFVDDFNDNGTLPSDQDIKEMTGNLDTMVDAIIQELDDRHEKRLKMLQLREWVRARSEAILKRVALPSKPDYIDDDAAKKATAFHEEYGYLYEVSRSEITNPLKE